MMGSLLVMSTLAPNRSRNERMTVKIKLLKHEHIGLRDYGCIAKKHDCAIDKVTISFGNIDTIS